MGDLVCHGLIGESVLTKVLCSAEPEGESVEALIVGAGCAEHLRRIAYLKDALEADSFVSDSHTDRLVTISKGSHLGEVAKRERVATVSDVEDAVVALAVVKVHCDLPIADILRVCIKAILNQLVQESAPIRGDRLNDKLLDPARESQFVACDLINHGGCTVPDGICLRVHPRCLPQGTDMPTCSA